MFRMFSVTLEQVFKDLSRWASFTLFALWNCRFFEEFVIPSWLKIEWNSRCDEFCHIFSFFSFYMSVHLFQIFGTIKMIFTVRCPTTLCPINLVFPCCVVPLLSSWGFLLHHIWWSYICSTYIMFNMVPHTINRLLNTTAHSLVGSSSIHVNYSKEQNEFVKPYSL